MFDRRRDELLEKIEQDLRSIAHTLRLHFNHHPTRATLRIEGAGMPATISVGGKGAQAVFTEFNSNGQAVPPLGTVGFTSSDPGIASVDSSGAVTAVAEGQATIVGLDATDNLTASDTVTVTADQTPASATLVLTAN